MEQPLTKKDFIDAVYLPLTSQKIKISKAKVKTVENLEGVVVLETANTIHIKIKNEIKKILKSSIEEIILYKKPQPLKVSMNYFLNTNTYRIKNIK